MTLTVPLLPSFAFTSPAPCQFVHLYNNHATHTPVSPFSFLLLDKLMWFSVFQESFQRQTKRKETQCVIHNFCPTKLSLSLSTLNQETTDQH